MGDPLIVMSRDELALLIRSEVTTSVRAALAERAEQSDWIDLDGAASEPSCGARSGSTSRELARMVLELFGQRGQW